MKDRFKQSRGLFATDKVPDTIFGIPVVSTDGQYTEADMAFFREHPEAGGYYDLGEETPDDGTAEGAPTQADAPKGDEAYQEWRATLPKPLQYEGDYDLRGYYNDPETKKTAVNGGHFIDKYKLPNHETFSEESIYATGLNAFLAGTWAGKNTYIPAPMKEFSLAFEEALEKHEVKGKDGKLYYRPHKRSKDDYDIHGYHYKIGADGALTKYTGDGLVPVERYNESVKAVDKSIDNVYNAVLRHHRVDANKLSRGIATATHDLVFQGGGETLQRDKNVQVKNKRGEIVTLKGSPLFHTQMKKFVTAEIPPEDAFGLAMLLEQDSYGGMNYRRFAARGKLIADDLARSKNQFARRIGKMYSDAWTAAPNKVGGPENEDAFGTTWSKHAAAMRVISNFMNRINVKHSNRREK